MPEANIITGQYVQISQSPASLGERIVAQIIDDRDVADDVVTLGRTVSFIELPGSDEESYTIVGSAEADPLEAKISNDSPIAKAIIGKAALPIYKDKDKRAKADAIGPETIIPIM